MKTTKQCPQCKTIQDLSVFGTDKKAPDGIGYICHYCRKENSIKHRRTKKGLTNQMYQNQKQNSKARNRPVPAYSLNDFRAWLFAQPLFHHLFHLWEVSNYDRVLVPSVDRIRNDEYYTFSNIQLMTWGENDIKGSEDHKNGILDYDCTPVNQLSQNGELIATYFSQNEASRITGISQSLISRVCNRQRPHTFGFVFRFKEYD